MNLENLKSDLKEDISRYVLKDPDEAKMILRKGIEQFLRAHGISDAEIKISAIDFRLFVRIAFDDVRWKFKVDICRVFARQDK